MKGRTSLLQALRVFLGGWRLRWVRPTVWLRRLERQAEKRRHRARVWAHRSTSPFQLEPLESRILLAADLTGIVGSAVLPNPALEGTTGSALVTVVNQGNLVSNRMEVGVYLSKDATLDASDILLGTDTSGSGVDAGKSKDFTIPFTISTQLDPGTYRLLAKVDNANATVENSETNNVAVGGSVTVSWQFGVVAGKPGQTSLTLRDADGTRATFSLTGPGTGEVVKNGSTWDVRLTGTTTATALTITTDAGGNGGLTLNKIDVAGALGSVTATTTNLLGALTVFNGPLPIVNAGTIAGGVVTANAAPVATNDTVSATEGGPAVAINVLANDADANAGDGKTIVGWNAQGLQGTVEWGPDGTSLIYSVGQAFNSLKTGATATETFTYTMRDTAGLTSSATVTVTIVGTNDGPVAQADSVTTQEGQPIAIAVLSNDGDPDAGDTLRIQSINNIVDGVVATGTMASGSINGVPMVYYTPRTQLSPGQTVTDQFSYTIVDSAGVQSTATVTVTIVGVNNAPVAVGDGVTVTEETGVLAVDVLANDTDPDIINGTGDTKTLTAVDGNGRPAQIVITSHPSQEVTTFIVIPAVPAIRGSVSIVDGQVQYDPTTVLQSLRAGQTLTETIFYTMTDAAGAVSSSTLVVTVTGANDGPTAVADTVTIGKNAAPLSINVLANDTDPDTGDTKTLVGFDTPLSGIYGTLAKDLNGNLVYTVDPSKVQDVGLEGATDTFSYTMEDSVGAQSMTTVTVEIVGENTAPVAGADTADATENGGPVTINVLTNDVDPDAGQEKTVISLNGAGLKGTVSIASDGTGIIYTVGQAFQELRAGETATETFSYTMADALGAQSTTTVTVTVTGVNDGLVAVSDTASVSEDSAPVTIDVVTNDRDADVGDTKQVLSLNTTGLIGTATIENGQVIYSVGNAFQSLRAGQTVTERFSYTVQDGNLAVSTATVTITVTGVNDAPVANADTLTVTEDASNVTLAVLTNDTDVDASETKTIVAVDGAGLVGTVSVAANGTGVLYSAGAAFQSLIAGETRTETFTYTMRDRDGALSTATVTLTVTGVTDGPKAVTDVAVAQEDGGAVVIHVLANDTNDANLDDQFTITSIDGSGQLPTFRTGFFDGAVQIIGVNPGFPRMLGTATIAADGHSIIYTAPESLNAGDTLVDTFIYTMKGSNGQSSSAVVRVTVTGGANDAPTAVSDTASMNADGGSVVIDVLANDTDPDTRIDPIRPPSSDLDFLLGDPTPADVADTKVIVNVNPEGKILQGSVDIAADGSSVIYTAGGALLTLAFGQTATETFTYTMRDGGGLESTGTVTVTIIGTNQAPVAEADTATASENGAPVTIDVLENDSDADVASGDTFSIVGIDTAGLQGTATVNGGQIVYTIGNAFQGLKAGETTTETFNYTIQDNRGAQSTGTVTVTVTGTNDGPVASNDGLTISEDAPALALNVLANDTDLDVGDTKTIVSLDTAGLQGTAAISADGSSVIYTVGQAFQYLESGVAFDTFTYTMRDSSGALSTARVTLTVLGAPEAPPAGAIMGTTGNDIITTAAANDAIYGQAGDDIISSGGGADTVLGGAGRDTIDGGDGNDVLVGGAQRDDLTGGLGADTFVYAQASDSTTAARDRIRDFSVAQGDKIDLRQIDAKTSINGDNAFVISTGFTGVAGQLVLTQINGGYLVAGDVNGDGVADLQIEVRTSDTLTAGDFML